MTFNRTSMASLPLALLVSGALSACAATPDGYPDLGLRDAERVTGTAQPVAPAPYVPPATPAGVLDRVSQLQAEARAADAAFRAEEQRSRAALAALGGAAEGSEAWAAGIAALADLEGLRSRGMVALADLDRLFVDAAVEGAETAPLATAREEVAALIARQDATIAAAAR